MNSWKLILNTFSAIDGVEGTIRMCGAKLPETCSTQDFDGVSLTVCNCQTDNCNKDNQCDCSSNPTTQGPTTQGPTTQGPTTQGPQTTTSSSTTTIGFSALILLISAFVSFEMK